MPSWRPVAVSSSSRRRRWRRRPGASMRGSPARSSCSRCAVAGSSSRVSASRASSRGSSPRRSPPPVRRPRFLHPVDSLHGDLGIVGSEDVAIVLSKSGESSDLDGLLASLERKGVPIIAITGEPSSFLGRVATAVLDASVSEEACPARPRAHVEHHRRHGAGRCARGGAAGGEGIPPRGLRRAASGRAARAPAAPAGARRDAAAAGAGVARDADARRHRAARTASGHRPRERRRPPARRLHRRRPHPARRTGAGLLRRGRWSRS